MGLLTPLAIKIGSQSWMPKPAPPGHLDRHEPPAAHPRPAHPARHRRAAEPDAHRRRPQERHPARDPAALRAVAGRLADRRLALRRAQATRVDLQPARRGDRGGPLRRADPDLHLARA
ncbi:hypothetical protein [Nocardioides convexus]|uniref:hypothetical protein n=1 Tax=Nocardioides convexus TaxID=2712224 RepID=UPI002418817F|nr:hypothetical protein [Nocardioides convexus]